MSDSSSAISSGTVIDNTYNTYHSSPARQLAQVSQFRGSLPRNKTVPSQVQIVYKTGERTMELTCEVPQDREEMVRLMDNKNMGNFC